jgi:gamma-glutamyl-gamma-aminobutyrate hydrolase PuuD
MRTVLVSQRLVNHPTEVREALDIELSAFLRECGLLAIPAPIRIPIKDLVETIRPDGIVLSGGNDLAVFKPDDKLSEMRDAFEASLIQVAVEGKLPLLGICRGMQMITHFFGGKVEKKTGHVAVQHDITFNGETPFQQMYGRARQVNSFHDYCISSVPPTLQAAASHADQTIEALKHTTYPIYGMMWHPERNRPFDVSDINFFSQVFGES